MPTDLILGDALEVVCGFPDESFTACFCDPPYGLKFMGKEWDHGVPSKEVWAEVLRVLKPGAILMAFGGTRTWHRLAVAIEDAGFELFDTMMWLYGSGFPKSHSIGKAIDKISPRLGQFTAFATHFWECWQASGLKRSQFIPYFRHYKNAESVMAQLSNWKLGKNVPTRRDYDILCELIGLSSNWEALIERMETEREVIGHSTNGAGNTGNEAVPFMSPNSKDFDLTAPATAAAKTWERYGTALKPSWEPILLARKPRRTTYAATAMEHGTACLNIEGCRVTTAPRDFEEMTDRSGRSSTAVFGQQEHDGWQPTRSGRWPANLLFSHSDCERVGVKRVKSTGRPNCEGRTYTGSSPQPMNRASGKEDTRRYTAMYTDPDGLETVAAYRCSPDCPVAMLDRQSGVSKSKQGGAAGQGVVGSTYHWSDTERRPVPRGGHNDSGGASRFFQCFERFYYCPKASRKERNMGLSEGQHSRHPTVKPLALCEYLARLIVPPLEYRDEAKLLVPFCGSGSEMIGALMGGWRNVTGIDIMAEYLEIARLRIAAHMKRSQQMTLGEIDG